MNEQINIESLIGKFFNGTILEDEHLELVSWIAQSKENELIFNQIREILLVTMVDDENFQFDVQAALEQVRSKIRLNRQITGFKTPQPRKVLTLSYRWAAVAAVFLFISGILLQNWIYRLSGTSDVYQEVIVPLGSQTKVVLPDGSQVNLNAGSTLRYPGGFGIGKRDVWLDGEGFFEVCKSSAPFIVHSGTVQIKALGTSFNVRAYSSDKIVETTLVSGKIEVTGTGHRETTRETLTLLPNQKLIISGSQENVDHVKEESSNSVRIPVEGMILKEDIDPVPEISWKDNKWIVNREDLGSLAVKLERRFDIEIVFQDEQLKSSRYNGSLPDLSLEQVLNVIKIASPVDFSINGKTVIFFENKKY